MGTRDGGGVGAWLGSGVIGSADGYGENSSAVSNTLAVGETEGSDVVGTPVGARVGARVGALVVGSGVGEAGASIW